MRMAATTHPTKAPARPLTICGLPVTVIHPTMPPIVVPADSRTNISPNATRRRSSHARIGAVIAPIGPPKIGPTTNPRSKDPGSCSSHRLMMSAAAPANAPQTAPAPISPTATPAIRRSRRSVIMVQLPSGERTRGEKLIRLTVDEPSYPRTAPIPGAPVGVGWGALTVHPAIQQSHHDDAAVISVEPW